MMVIAKIVLSFYLTRDVTIENKAHTRAMQGAFIAKSSHHYFPGLEEAEPAAAEQVDQVGGL